MHESNNIEVIQEENIVIKKKRVKVFSVFLAFILIGVGFLFGYSFNNKPQEIKDYKVYVNDESQTFRNAVGRKVYPLVVDAQVYLPISGLGSYLDYMTIIKDNELYLYTTKETIDSKLVTGFETESMDGKIVNDSLFKESDYTVFMVWATWCKYCVEEIQSFKSIEGYLEESNVQLISVPTDLPLLHIKETLDTETLDKVIDKAQGLNFKYHLFRDDILNSKLVGNTVSIPKLVIFDNEGNLIKIIDEDITGEDFKVILSNIIK